MVRMGQGQRFLRGARRPGFFALLLGVFALGLNYHWASSEGHVEMKTLMIGIACLPIGLAMIVCPGSVDLPLITAEPPPLGELMGGLTPFEKFVWLAALVLGLGAGFYVLFAL
jgi:hypothetical protein